MTNHCLDHQHSHIQAINNGHEIMKCQCDTVTTYYILADIFYSSTRIAPEMYIPILIVFTPMLIVFVPFLAQHDYTLHLVLKYHPLEVIDSVWKWCLSGNVRPLLSVALELVKGNHNNKHTYFIDTHNIPQ